MGVSLRAIDVCKKFTIRKQQVLALRDVNLELGAGQIGAIIGPSGCGKSTLLRLFADLLPVTSGEVRAGGTAPWALRQQKQIAFAFQTPTLLSWKTVRQNIVLPAEIGPRDSRKRDDALLDELLAMVGLAQFADALPRQLSGGMQQRVAIARALYLRPQLLLMDEPFGALDELTRQLLNVDVSRMLRGTGTSVILVTHNIAEAVFMADRVWVMSARPGTIVSSFDIDLPTERDIGLLDQPKFVALASQIRSILFADRAR
jgi:NitT/TauT family transport system ATP-binding protein